MQPRTLSHEKINESQRGDECAENADGRYFPAHHLSLCLERPAGREPWQSQLCKLGVRVFSAVCRAGHFVLCSAGGLQVCERPGKALGFFVGDVLHQYDHSGHRLPSPVCDHALFGQIAGLYGSAPHHELADLLHDHRHRMDLHDL